MPALLLAERPIWLLDEPTVSLDRAAQEMLTAAVDAHLAARRPGGGGDACAARLRQVARAASRQRGAAPHERVLASSCAATLLLAWKEGGTIGVALGFYLIVVTLLPLGIGPDLNLLARIAPGVLWVALLLSALLSLGRMFESDLEDGSLEVLATGPLPLEAVAAAKSLAHWLTTGVPLTVLAPLLGLLLNLRARGLRRAGADACWPARRPSASSAPSARR